MRWLWSSLAGLSLVAYVFWIPNLLASLAEVILLSAALLLLGVSLLQDGFLMVLQERAHAGAGALPQARARRIAAGVLLLGFTAAYTLPQTRLSAYWPIESSATALLGLTSLVFGAMKATPGLASRSETRRPDD